MSRESSSPGTGRTLFAVLALVALLALSVAVAQADPAPATGTPADALTQAATNPFATGEALDNQGPTAAVTPNTDLTPKYRDGSQLWQLVAGARFGEAQAIDGSVTSFSDELDAVSFLNTQEGFAGGSETLDCPTGKLRVPVIYEYTDTKTQGLQWRPSYKGDCSHPGYVGAIAWIAGSGKAVAVGGTGSYPKREPAYGQDIDGNPCTTDGAGTTKP